jgi:thiosulfate dehydrogenase (quinone) large subunit
MSLVVLRLLIGWHLFYEGMAKLLMQNWSSASFLGESKWILSGFSSWVLSHETVLRTVDFLNVWGLMAIGLALLLGLFTRPAAWAGVLLLLLYYVSNPPLIGLEYSLPSEGSYLIVNKTLIEAMALLVLALFPMHRVFGLEYLFGQFTSTSIKK